MRSLVAVVLLAAVAAIVPASSQAAPTVGKLQLAHYQWGG
jgi:hypothetical protein